MSSIPEFDYMAAYASLTESAIELIHGTAPASDRKVLEQLDDAINASTAAGCDPASSGDASRLLAHLRRVQVKPGDVFVLTLPASSMAIEVAARYALFERLHEDFDRVFPGHGLVILPPDFQLAVAGAVEPEQDRTR